MKNIVERIWVICEEEGLTVEEMYDIVCYLKVSLEELIELMHK